MIMKVAILLVASATLVASQRPFFAGSHPIGYPEVTTEGLQDRFGEVDGTSTTQKLPLEANGDRELVDRLSKLPIDKQPFWLLNWQALQANRENPQTYPQKDNVFIDSFSNMNSNTVPSSNTNFALASNPIVIPANNNLAASSGTPSNVNSNSNGNSSESSLTDRFGAANVNVAALTNGTSKPTSSETLKPTTEKTENIKTSTVRPYVHHQQYYYL